MTTELDTIVEALIFASPEGVSTKEITRCIKAAAKTAKEAEPENPPEQIMQYAAITEEEVTASISRLNLTYIEQGRAFLLQERPAGWRIMSRMEYSPWVREMFPDKRPARLSAGALETLAIIAYRQPLTRSSIEAVRGVAIDGPLQTLLDRNMVRIAGRADLPGRPLLYETTELFLEHFGIRTVEELPNSAELRSVKLPEAPPPSEETPPAEQPELPIEGEAGEPAAEGEAPSEDPAAEEKPRKKPRGKKKKETPAAEQEPAPEEPVVVVTDDPPAG